MKAFHYSDTLITPLVTGRIRVSRNLRGLRDYARVHSVACVITRKDPDNNHRGVLHVVYSDGSIGRASFACHSIMIDFVRNRRTWRNATIRHLDGCMGYLTGPGTIAGDTPC